jgi:hypothetical protein
MVGRLVNGLAGMTTRLVELPEQKRMQVQKISAWYTKDEPIENAPWPSWSGVGSRFIISCASNKEICLGQPPADEDEKLLQ